MQWKESQIQPGGRWVARLGGRPVTVIQHDDRTWHTDLPFGHDDRRIALAAKDGERARSEAEAILRDRLRRLLAEVDAP